nr:DUF3089 domain-containing protein [Lachnospiraceae bacterium]
NTREAHLKRNGRYLYEFKHYLADGSVQEEFYYEDDTRYVADDSWDIFILEDNEAYDYEKEPDRYYRYLFPDNFDSFKDSLTYPSMFKKGEGETIISKEVRDGLIYMKTFVPYEDFEEYADYYGYSGETVDSIMYEYVIDEATDEILELNGYVVKDGKKTIYIEGKYDPDCEVYVPDKELVDAIFGEDTRTVNVITDAGTEHEKKYSQTVTKGSYVLFWQGEDFYPALYSDPECVTKLENVDITEDSTIYAKRKPDYSDKENWAYYNEGDEAEKDADLFLICPTVDVNDEFNMSLDDTETKAKFLGALNMERGIYEENTRMFAPYYRQGAMKIYSLTPEEREPYLEYAYDDISEAFRCYLENENNGRPIVLAGFSQGADMCYRLLEEYFEDEELQERLVGVYAIGWPCTEEMAGEFPQIKPAAGEYDTGVVISIDCEAPSVTDTFITPAGIKACTINPLNWRTDKTAADKTENLGACFTDYDGNIIREEKELCGCYIDEERGILKVTDVTEEDYPALIPGLPEGAFHIYDYQFFFRNLEKNVGDRIKSITGK